MNLDLLGRNALLSLCAAAVGVVTPIGLSYALLYLGFGYGALETFIVGAALSTTSVGTTFVVLKGATTADVDFSGTRVGIVLVSAALFDDICGLVMISVIENLAGISGGESLSIGWVVGRPIVASLALGVVPALIAMFAFLPLHQRYFQIWLCKTGYGAFITIEAAVLSAFLAIARYTGASLLFGAFMAGTFLGVLSGSASSSVTPESAPVNACPEDPPTFAGAFAMFISGPMRFIFQPLFFSSIGSSIPFKNLWTGEAIWKGVTFSLLMFIGKAAVSICIPLRDLLDALQNPKARLGVEMSKDNWPSPALLGCAMVARGEIGLLIIQTGLNRTPFLSKEAFSTAVWAIVLNTIVGPLLVGILVRTHHRKIAHNPRWGLQDGETVSVSQEERRSVDGDGIR
ncbi:hypothetical protein MAPG_07248 [Magnaporthiopsis poae ATCC 64411]|uniref:Cation/H+ exchanger transmembrane domain-containing protein n=1 Tax=Magnaporthiopsis poae (strain ATCC 64411 / 73-15) TaxID=644358 RepID=A0A0C4E459_MAGP6|nr:hypothetical protein MAPG_07248 [Magnaporthiopsis poae ATCC 64411]